MQETPPAQIAGGVDRGRSWSGVCWQAIICPVGRLAIGKRALGGPAALAIPALVLLLLVTVLPLTWLFAISILDPVPGFGNYNDLLSRAGFQRAFLRTLKMATIVTAVTLVFGYPYAYAMTIAGRKTWLVLTLLVLLPLWDQPYGAQLRLGHSPLGQRRH